MSGQVIGQVSVGGASGQGRSPPAGVRSAGEGTLRRDSHGSFRWKKRVVVGVGVLL